MGANLSIALAGAFESNDIEAMSLAFQKVCHALLINGDASDREIIAVRIIELARRGERRPTVLCDRVLAEANDGAGWTLQQRRREEIHRRPDVQEPSAAKQLQKWHTKNLGRFPGLAAVVRARDNLPVNADVVGLQKRQAFPFSLRSPSRARRPTGIIGDLTGIILMRSQRV